MHYLFDGVGERLSFGVLCSEKTDEFYNLLFTHHPHFFSKVLLCAFLDLFFDFGVCDDFARLSHLLNLHIFKVKGAVFQDVFGLVAEDGFDEFV